MSTPGPWMRGLVAWFYYSAPVDPGRKIKFCSVQVATSGLARRSIFRRMRSKRSCLLPELERRKEDRQRRPASTAFILGPAGNRFRLDGLGGTGNYQ